MEGRIPRPVLLAGLLGGVIGAILSFALSKTFPSTPKPQSQVTPTAPPDARAFADDIVAKLKAGKDDELKPLVRLAFREKPDDVFEKGIWGPFVQVREAFPTIYGRSLSFECVREHLVSQDAVRFVYLERFAHGCVVWYIDCYNSPDGWQLVGFQNYKLDSAFEMLK